MDVQRNVFENIDERNWNGWWMPKNLLKFFLYICTCMYHVWHCNVNNIDWLIVGYAKCYSYDSYKLSLAFRFALFSIPAYILVYTLHYSNASHTYSAIFFFCYVSVCDFICINLMHACVCLSRWYILYDAFL